MAKQNMFSSLGANKTANNELLNLKIIILCVPVLLMAYFQKLYRNALKTKK